MKNTLLLLSLIFLVDFAFGQGDAPPMLQGQNQTSKTVAPVIKVPASQATKVTGGALIETGNKNILEDPSFEAAVRPASWVVTSGSLTAETTVVIDGKKSVVSVFSSTTTVTQDSTLYSAQFADGPQGLAMVRVKTSQPGVKVCSRQANTTSTSNCVTHSGSGKWELLKVPFILGGTSNGISIAGSSGTSGDVYIDDAFVGPADLKVDTPLVETQSSALVQTATFGAGVTITGASTASNGSAVYSYNSSTGIYTVLKKALFNIEVSFSATGAARSQATIRVDGTDVAVSNSESAGGVWDSTGYSGILVAGQTFYIMNNANSTNAQKISVSASYSGATSLYSSTNKDFGWTSYSPTYSSLGTVTGYSEYKRQGDTLLLRGRFTTSVPAAAALKISLPVHNGTQLTAKSFNSQNQILDGTFGSDYTGATQSGIVPVVLDAERTVIQFGFNNSRSSFNVLNASTILINGSAVGWTAMVPIEGWENSNVIVGSFDGLEKCVDSFECEDTYYRSSY
jgi:hypothetical protein